jgi:hypothetical protein
MTGRFAPEAAGRHSEVERTGKGAERCEATFSR